MTIKPFIPNSVGVAPVQVGRSKAKRESHVTNALTLLDSAFLTRSECAHACRVIRFNTEPGDPRRAIAEAFDPPNERKHP